ncbi:DUF1990 family protein [Nakamurella alba]|uniref:DUF1990 family protein n=1 Tax=Nakamurella alba TaxID=2665158 RepID=UPI0018AA4C90|nr:DUF1990 domain-containing protein [Nakamurella alba]
MRPVADLGALPPTFESTGIGTDADQPVSGPHPFRGERRIGSGPSFWEFAAHETLRWGIKTRSGFRVIGADGGSVAGTPASVGQRIWLSLGIGRLRVREPVRITAVIREPDRVGFAYGTLAGHPLRGEESFVVERRPDGVVHLVISSVSTVTGAWRLVGPLVRLAQWHFRWRYFRAFRRESAQR